MDKPVITGKLVHRYEIDFGKGKAVVNKYLKSLTKDEMELNRMNVKNILAKVFGKNGI